MMRMKTGGDGSLKLGPFFSVCACVFTHYIKAATCVDLKCLYLFYSTCISTNVGTAVLLVLQHTSQYECWYCCTTAHVSATRLVLVAVTDKILA